MRMILAKLGESRSDGAREILVRDRHLIIDDFDDIKSLSPSSLVLLHGDSHPWHMASCPRTVEWPLDELGSPEDLWTNQQRRQEIAPAEIVSVTGRYSLDPRGKPCELGPARRSGPYRYVLNYAGWRLADIQQLVVDAYVCKAPAGLVLVIPPSSIDHPRAAKKRAPTASAAQAGVAPPSDDVAPSQLLSPGGGSRRAAERYQSPPRSTARDDGPRAAEAHQPVHEPFSTQRSFAQLTFHHGYITTRVNGKTITIESAISRAVFNDTRPFFDELQPDGIRIRWRFTNGEVELVDTQGLETLDRLFREARYRAYIERYASSSRWIDADKLATANPAAPPGATAEDLISVPEFFEKRRSIAICRLLAIRDNERKTWVLPRRAFIVPIRAIDSQLRWYAWETVDHDYATYLFRPRSDDEREHMLSWTRDTTRKRQELLRDRSLQGRLGYCARVYHYDDDDEALGRWWRNLCKAIGIPARRPRQFERQFE